MDFLNQYRPKRLGDVLGQPAVVRALKQFVAEPYSVAMLFHGDTGVGKTSTAFALAADLGCRVEEGDLGGVIELASGEQNGQHVRDTLRRLSLRPFFGSGWKVAIVNEVDRMTDAAETVWLDGLESLPDRSVVVMTTNSPERLSRRMRERCDQYAFEGRREKLQPVIQKMARRIWSEQVGGKVKPPKFDKLGVPNDGLYDCLNVSFRLAIQQLSRLVREARRGNGTTNLDAVAAQIDRDSLGVSSYVAQCDHCGHTQEVYAFAKKVKCVACGKTFTME